jgi:hypothetical protein
MTKRKYNPLNQEEVDSLAEQAQKYYATADYHERHGEERLAMLEYGNGMAHKHIAQNYKQPGALFDMNEWEREKSRRWSAARGRKVNPASGPADEHAARELELYITSDSKFTPMREAIYRNLMTKWARGQYDPARATQAFMYLVEAGAKAYLREFSTPGDPMDLVFNRNTRLAVAASLRDYFQVEAKLGNYSTFLPKKYAGFRPNPPAATDELPPKYADDPAFKRELAAYRKMHGNDPISIVEVEVPDGYPRFMSAYGTTPEVVYDATKKSTKGKRIHKFGEDGGAVPFLVTSQERGPKFLAFAGGTFKAKEWIYR